MSDGSERTSHARGWRALCVGGLLAIAPGCGEAPTGPAGATLTGDGLRLSAAMDRPSITPGVTAILVLRVENTRDDAVAVPPASDGCGLMWEALDAVGRGVQAGCATAEGARRLAAREVWVVRVPVTAGPAPAAPGGGVVLPAGRYRLRAVLGPRTLSPAEVLSTSNATTVDVLSS